jgi:hypothetical protein
LCCWQYETIPPAVIGPKTRSRISPETMAFPALRAMVGAQWWARSGGAAADHAAYLKELSGSTGIEGEVIVFATGERYKVKTAEYVRMHKALAGLAQEKDALALVLADDVDDVLSLVSADLAEKLELFAGAVYRGLDHCAVALAALFRDGHAACVGDRKRFATEFAQKQLRRKPRSCSLSGQRQARATRRRAYRRVSLSPSRSRRIWDHRPGLIRFADCLVAAFDGRLRFRTWMRDLAPGAGSFSSWPRTTRPLPLREGAGGGVGPPFDDACSTPPPQPPPSKGRGRALCRWRGTAPT